MPLRSRFPVSGSPRRDHEPVLLADDADGESGQRGRVRPLLDRVAEWSAREGLAAHARLLRDIDEPGRFVSFGPWETVEAIMRWRTLPSFQEHVARMTELLERFDSHTVELVTEH